MFGTGFIWSEAFRERGALTPSTDAMQNKGKPKIDLRVVCNSASVGAESPITKLEKGKISHEIDFMRFVPYKPSNARAYPNSWALDPTHYNVAYCLEGESILPTDIAVSAGTCPRGFDLGSLLDYDPLHSFKSGIYSDRIKQIGVFDTHSILDDMAPPITPLTTPGLLPSSKILGGANPTMATAWGHLTYSRYLFSETGTDHEKVSDKMLWDAATYARKAWRSADAAAKNDGEECPADLLEKLSNAIMHNEFGIRNADDAALIIECLDAMFSNGSMVSCTPDLVFIYWIVCDLQSQILPHASLTDILRLTNAVSSVMRFDRRFELVMGACVHETVRRVSLSKRAFSRSCGDDAATIAAAVPAVAGIMKVVVENFCKDLKAMPSSKREILQQGPWKEPSVADWLNTLWQPGPYCAALDARPPAKMQVHYTQAPGMIQKLARFLACQGCSALPALSIRDVYGVAKGIFSSLCSVLKNGCLWLAADMSTVMNELIQDVVVVVSGEPAPEKDLFEALRAVCSARLS